ncbi:MAG: hypothetical protein PHD21_01515 [Flavobacteriales bacterium]|nr:hypothetical protein [Flavobacteriales bacterium]
MNNLKSFMLPVAMLVGAVFYEFFYSISVAIPYFIFTMLLLTFCKLSPKELRFKPLHIWLLMIQILGSVAVYGALYFIDQTVAEGAFMTIFAPTAMAAAVITGMLGGSVAFLTSYVFMSSMAVAVFAPVIFSFMGTQSEMPFLESFLLICKKVIPLLVFPLLTAWFLRFFVPKVHDKLIQVGYFTFYLWAVSLTTITGRTVKFIVEQKGTDYTLELSLAAVGLVICLLQFIFGKKIGSVYGERIAAGQAMGQKNTILAIWLAQVYLNPVSSIVPASYVLWQNLVNSYQLWKKNRRDKQSF